MRWTREEYIELMTFGGFERQMFVELFGPLVGLDGEWKQQGAKQEEIELTHFCFDYVDAIGTGGNVGVRRGYKPVIIEETNEHIIQRDELGRTTKLCKGVASIPLPLDYPVKDMDSWLKIKHFYTFHEERIDWDIVEKSIKLQKEGSLVVASMLGGFDLPRQLMGEEEGCICYYEQPELMMDIMQTISDTAFKVFDRISDKLGIDNLFVHEDMAGKSGPLVGPNIISEFIKPYYLRTWEMLSSKGTKIFSQDSDGNMNSVIDAFLECGLTTMLPMEPAAGMDVVELRKKYGKRLSFKGGIDKHVLRKGKEDILKELEYKMQPIMQEGGMVFGIDHRIPNGTSIENYRYYVNTAREVLGLPPVNEAQKGWGMSIF